MFNVWPFKKRNVGAKIEQLERGVVSSFSQVREDTSHHFAWLQYLYNQAMQQQRVIDELRHALTQPHQIPVQQLQAQLQELQARMRTIEETIASVSSSITSPEPLLRRVSEMNTEVQVLEQKQKPILERLHELSTKIDRLSDRRTIQGSNLRQKIVKKVARHSKEYTKNLILSTIKRYDQISALQLREIIVDEQALCSKSSFYRLLAELENSDEVEVIVAGKEKVYLLKVTVESRI